MGPRFDSTTHHHLFHAVQHLLLPLVTEGIEVPVLSFPATLTHERAALAENATTAALPIHDALRKREVGMRVNGGQKLREKRQDGPVAP